MHTLKSILSENIRGSTDRRKMKNYDDYSHIDEDRDNQLFAAVQKRQDEDDQASKTISEHLWFTKYDEAMVEFEEGHPEKLINLEKELGIVWKEPTQ